MIGLSYPIPVAPYIPGAGRDPDRAAFAALRLAVPTRVSDDNWSSVAAYLHGFALLEAGCFWEAHEVWEAVWLATAPAAAERRLMAALIQLANAGLKQRMRRLPAVLRLLAESRAHAEAARIGAPGPSLMGLDPGGLVAAVAVLSRHAARHEIGADIHRIVFARAGRPGCSAAIRG